MCYEIVVNVPGIAKFNAGGGHSHVKEREMYSVVTVAKKGENNACASNGSRCMYDTGNSP